MTPLAYSTKRDVTHLDLLLVVCAEANTHAAYPRHEKEDHTGPRMPGTDQAIRP